MDKDLAILVDRMLIFLLNERKRDRRKNCNRVDIKQQVNHFIRQADLQGLDLVKTTPSRFSYISSIRRVRNARHLGGATVCAYSKLNE